MMNLTTKEAKVLKEAATVSCELGGECTWFDATDLTDIGFNKHEIAGIMGSLEVKNFINCDDDPAYVTPEGVTAICAHLDV